MPYAARTGNKKQETRNPSVKLRASRKQEFQVSSFKFQIGYTLVEFLVVLGLLVLVVGSTLMFLNSVLRGTNEANVTAEVKQNGQSLLDALERQIRNATDVACSKSDGVVIACSDPMVSNKYLKLIRANADPMHIKCFSDDTGSKSVNGWIGSVVSVSTPSDNSYVSLTNQNKISGTDIVSCNFSVRVASSGTSGPPIVSIVFTVNQGINAPSRVDFKADAQFQTTISLRRY